MVLEFETPKTDAGTRDIPTTPEVEQCFRNLIKKRERTTVEPVVGGKAGCSASLGTLLPGNVICL